MPNPLPERHATPEQLQRNLAEVQARIAAAAARAGRDPAEIALVAVTKTVGVEEIAALHALGVKAFGENRVEVARTKVEALPDDIAWHMIGQVQRRKARDVVRLFRWVDSVDRIAVAEALQQRCEAADTHISVCLETNISGEEAKHGFAPDALTAALDALAGLDRLEVRGLMTMAPFGAEESMLRTVFSGLRELAQAHGITGLSMGMTDDYEIAIEEGATEVRVGRALYV